MSKRVLVTGIWHETNTFSVVRTDLAAFHAYQYAVGADVFARHDGTNTEIGGMVAAAGRHGLTLVPGVSAGAIPSGLITEEAFEHIISETCRRAAAEAPLDGALVALHGAMSAEGAPDADHAYLSRLRKVLGGDCPVVATFDLHANISPALFAEADVLIGYDTFPHVDMAERGAEAVAVLAEMLESGRRPAKAMCKLPLLTVPQTQGTNDQPMVEMMRLLHEAEAGAGVRVASIAQGFPYADIPHLGVTVLAYGDDKTAIDGTVERIGAAIWSHRQELVPALVTPQAAVAEAMAADEGPVVLVDVADNVGGGSAADGTVVLAALLEAGAPSAVVVIWDPGQAARANELGAGVRFAGEVGGKVDDQHGPPVAIEGIIEFARPVTYTRRGSYMTGQTVDLGQVAIVNSGGVKVVLTERRALPFDSDHLWVLGIVPEDERILVAKSATAWRAAFGDIARHHVYVDTPGICASNLAQYSYTQGPEGYFPLNPDATWLRS